MELNSYKLTVLTGPHKIFHFAVINFSVQYIRGNGEKNLKKKFSAYVLSVIDQCFDCSRPVFRLSWPMF